MKAHTVVTFEDDQGRTEDFEKTVPSDGCLVEVPLQPVFRREMARSRVSAEIAVSDTIDSLTCSAIVESGRPAR